MCWPNRFLEYITWNKGRNADETNYEVNNKAKDIKMNYRQSSKKWASECVCVPDAVFLCENQSCVKQREDIFSD